MPNKILIVHLGALGDLLLSRPALVAIRMRFPQAEMDFLGYPHLTINSHLKLTPFSHLKLTPSKKKYRSSIMDSMMEEKGDDFYGGVGNQDHVKVRP